MSVAVIDNDKGFKRIVQAINAMQKEAHVVVGILQNAGTHDKSNLTIAQIGAVHEYGSEKQNIPERSFMRSTFDEKRSANMAFVKQLYGKVLEGKMTEHQALTMLGEVVSKQMVEKINNFVPPKNAESTKLRKDSSRPLIDTGRLKGSISFEVRNAKN